MKKEIRNITEDGKTVQVTIADERWYLKTAPDGSITEYPSVTWIAEHYPKGIEFYKWLAKHGWNEAESIKEAAGDKGHKVHQGISSLLLGNNLRMDDTLRNADTCEPEPIKLEEYEALLSFAAWFKEKQPKTIQNELVVFNEQYRFAGTADYICEVAGERWLIDFKTSQYIWPSFEMQLSAYAHALPPELRPQKLGILQVGYRKNKQGFKLTPVEDQFDLFLAAKRIWQKECEGVSVFKKEYPISISL